MGKNNTSVKKGQILNPKGRPVGTKIVPDEVKKYNSVIIADTISKYITMDLLQLNDVIKNPNLPVLDIFIARILATGVQKSDQAKLNFIFERMVGKVKDHVDVTSSDGSLAPNCLNINFIDKDDDKLS
jgi:hypothetical protein